MSTQIGIKERIIARLLETAGMRDCDDHFSIDRWEWPQGIALYAIYLDYRKTGNEAGLDTLRAWFTRRIAAGLPERNVNTTAPLLALAFLAEHDGNAAWMDLCTAWAEWVMTAMPRTEERGLQHITSNLVNEGELWADTLFMTVLFLAKMGEIAGRRDWADEAAYQFLLHAKYLADPESGLWFHGWTFKGRNHFGGIHWARGNAWFTAGAVEYLEIARPVGAVRSFIAETLRSQIRALSAVQDESGLWNTILGDGKSYLETSGSAAIAYGMLKASRLGIADSRAAGEKAARGVLAKVDGNGIVTGVSHGTAVGMDREHYLGIRLSSTAYGQGLAYLMLQEVDGDASRAGTSPCR
jgi:unsaturated rhamnogalacturonyl hydrolase